MEVSLNREIKAYCADFVPVRQILRSLGAVEFQAAEPYLQRAFDAGVELYGADDEFTMQIGELLANAQRERADD